MPNAAPISKGIRSHGRAGARKYTARKYPI